MEEEEMPKPNWPVHSLNVAESQQYLQDLLNYIVKSHLKLKQAEFKKWLKILEDGTKVPATTLDLWEEEVETVLPRQDSRILRPRQKLPTWWVG